MRAGQAGWAWFFGADEKGQMGWGEQLRIWGAQALPCLWHPLSQPHTLFLSVFPCRYDMRDVLAIESAWLTELAPHMYRLVPLNPQMRR